MQDVKSLLEQVTPEVYQRLKLAVEIGKWPDGVRLTDEQKAHCLQAIIYYDQKHLPEEQQTGYVEGQCGQVQAQPWQIPIKNED